MNLPCAVISVLTDECDPNNLKPVSLEQIIATAQVAEKQLTELMVAFLEKVEKN